MLEKELELLKQRPNVVQDYVDGIAKLYNSGVFSFLRYCGRVVFTSGKDTPDQVALNGAYAAGFQEALDLLFNFKEIFLDPKASKLNLRADYGGTTLAVKMGDLTQEEADAIRLNSKFGVKPGSK